MNNPEQSTIQRATLDVLADLGSAITHEWKAHGVPIPEKEFRRIMALFLTDQTTRDWCRHLGIEIPEGTPPDPPESHGQRRER